MLSLAAIRELFPVTHNYVILDNASESPSPLPVVRKMTDILKEYASSPLQDRDIDAIRRRALSVLERLLGVPSRNLLFVPSTTAGFAMLASSLRLDPGDVVVIPENEFPAVVAGWFDRSRRDRDIKVELLSVEPPITGGTPLALLEKWLRRPEVKVLCLSAVGWLGYRYSLADVEKMCSKHDVIFAIDGTQTVGMIDLSFPCTPLSFLSTAFYKWGLGPDGIGCLYIGEELRQRLEPRFMNLDALSLDENRLLAYELYNLKFPALPGPLALFCPPPVLLAGLTAAAELLLEIGLSGIERYVLELAQKAISGLMGLGYIIRSETKPEHQSAIVVFSHPDPAKNAQICRRLREQRVYIRLREGLLRISVHIYNVQQDIDRLLDALAGELEVAPRP